MVKICKKFLDQELIDDVVNYAKDSSNKYVWKVNQLFWNEDILAKGKEVCILDLENFKDRFIKIYRDKKIVNNNLQIKGVFFYVWGRGSFIPFHNDGVHEAASSIYLNDIWDPDDGGLFLWRDELNNLNVIEPEYNKMIFNSNKISHSVTMITPFSEQLRYTVQIFFKSN